MSDQKKEPDVSPAPSTTAHLGLFAPEITQLISGSSLSTDAQIVPVVLAQNGCKLSIDWHNNDTVKQCRWFNEDKNLIVDLFLDQRGRLKLSLHNSAVWQSPQDQQMPRFAKTVAYAISAAGCKVRYQQESLSKYAKGGRGDE